MHYELYVDSLFLVNFVMNLYLLMLVNHSIQHIAAPLRLIGGAALGAVCFLLPFLVPAPAWLKLGAGILIGTAGMLRVSFPVRGFRMFLKLLEKLLLYSFGMGGGLLFLIRCLPGIRNFMTGILGILGAGGVLFLLLSRMKTGWNLQEGLCRATLSREGKRVTVNALIDSGNSLVEPISGKPVCVVDAEIYERLWESGAQGFRAIPYHSIGKRKGILQGYPLSGLSVEEEGMCFTFRDVYIAVSDESIQGAENAGGESVNMIINPMLFAERKKGKPQRRQNERHNDSESNDTGQDSV